MATDNADNSNSISLSSLREQIDRLDAQLVELLNRRAEVVVHIGKLKSRAGTPVYSPDREKQVIDRVVGLSHGPLPATALTAIYRELMSGSFALERSLRIGYLGPEGSFSHAGATAKFGSSVEYCALADIRSVFEEVARGRVDLGMVPIENTIGGGIIDTLDAFLDLEVRICAEVLVAIHHNLLGQCAIDGIEKVYSKPEVFTQCRRWLSSNELADKTVGVASTSRAAEQARSEPRAAAIGSTLAATLYDVPVLVSNIEDNPNNVTRFLVIAKQMAKPTGDDKTTIMFTTAHKVGALADVLDVFRRHTINLTNIGSRPSRKQNWEYYFFVDCEGHFEMPKMASAIAEVREHCLQINVLGSFPRATEVSHMIVIMQSGADPATVDHVIDRIQQLGLKPHVSRGQFRTIIGAIGEEADAFLPQLASLPGVENVVQIMKPYKLASREFHPETSQFQIGPVLVGGPGCVAIAGPCAIENETTVFAVGRAAKASGATMLRGGAFKPRTSPYSFQGLGEDGLKILRAAGDELGMPVVSEVMDPRQVPVAVKYVDVMQVGARNMQNFSLLSEVGQTDCPVLLKRGLSASVKEWLMSAEYILAQGNKRVILCERGIKTFETSVRYTFDVSSIPVLKRESHLPVFVDPSHAAGERDLVSALALAGIAAGADGFIVEVHDCPEKAMCDGPQALTPEMFSEMMAQCRAVATAIGRSWELPGAGPGNRPVAWGG